MEFEDNGSQRGLSNLLKGMQVQIYAIPEMKCESLTKTTNTMNSMVLVELL